MGDEYYIVAQFGFGLGLPSADAKFQKESGCKKLAIGRENPGITSSPNQMMTLLVEIKDQVEIAKTAGISALNPTQLLDFDTRYRELIQQGFKANPPPLIDPLLSTKKGRPKQSPPKNLLDRLHTNQSAVLAFMYDFRVPFDNNQAERDLRMMKLKQKISGTFRSLEGAQMFCRIRGYISTLRKQGINILDALKQVFLGNPVFPSL
jgi:transposase